MIIKTYQVDAFTDVPFKGNPAAVCILDKPLNSDLMKNIAEEMNLSETAFIYPLEEKEIRKCSKFSIKWFSPKVEVALCGHATLAASHVLFNEIGVMSERVSYESLGGELCAINTKEGITLDFPTDKPQEVEEPKELLKAVGIEKYNYIGYGSLSKYVIVEVDNENIVLDINPNFDDMLKAGSIDEYNGLIVTSRGHGQYDFISRFFDPWEGINEDSVTGSAHTVLGPYWKEKLGKSKLCAFQSSSRGGKLILKFNHNEENYGINRIELIGKAVTVFKGELFI